VYERGNTVIEDGYTYERGNSDPKPAVVAVAVVVIGMVLPKYR
jgi:hypothetical protein